MHRLQLFLRSAIPFIGCKYIIETGNRHWQLRPYNSGMHDWSYTSSARAPAEKPQESLFLPCMVPTANKNTDEERPWHPSTYSKELSKALTRSQCRMSTHPMLTTRLRLSIRPVCPSDREGSNRTTSRTVRDICPGKRQSSLEQVSSLCCNVHFSSLTTYRYVPGRACSP